MGVTSKIENMALLLRNHVGGGIVCFVDVVRSNKYICYSSVCTLHTLITGLQWGTRSFISCVTTKSGPEILLLLQPHLHRVC